MNKAYFSRIWHLVVPSIKKPTCQVNHGKLRWADNSIKHTLKTSQNSFPMQSFYILKLQPNKTHNSEAFT